jgi:bifunctional non-homologous end joining protein LigD
MSTGVVQIRIKTPIRHTAQVIIAGWSPSSTDAHVLAALLLAARDADGELVYVGDVGTGFTDAARRHLADLLQPLRRDVSPFARARGRPGRPPARGAVVWVAPRLVGEIEYRSFTRNQMTSGGSFRHPSWRGLRPDRNPDEVRLPASS